MLAQRGSKTLWWKLVNEFQVTGKACVNKRKQTSPRRNYSVSNLFIYNQGLGQEGLLIFLK